MSLELQQIEDTHSQSGSLKVLKQSKLSLMFGLPRVLGHSARVETFDPAADSFFLFARHLESSVSSGARLSPRPPLNLLSGEEGGRSLSSAESYQSVQKRLATERHKNRVNLLLNL